MNSLEDPSPRAGDATRRVVGWFFLTVTVLVVVASFVYQSMVSLIEQGRWVSHTYEVLEVLQETLAGLREVEASQRGYLLSGQPEHLAAYQSSLGKFPENAARLRGLTVDNPSQQIRLDRLEARVRERLDAAAEVLESYRRDGLEAARAAVSEGLGRRKMAELLEVARGIEAEERRLLIERRRASESAARTTLLVGGTCLLACLGVLGFVFRLVLREWSRRRETEGSLQAAKDRLEVSLRDLGEMTEQAALVASLGDYLHACRSPVEAYAIVSKTVPHLLPGLSGSVAITSHSRTLVETVLTWGDPLPFAAGFHPDECWGLRRGRSHDVGGGTDPVCEHLTGDSIGFLCVPMAVHGETLGVLSVSSDRPSGLSDRERQTAGALAEQVSMALANLRLQEALRDRSIRDPLTGLFNRRYLEESLGREICRARRHGQPLAVVMADVDHFKRFNDSHGHDAGDAVLAEVGKLLARQVRGEDVACRYGGEEFCLILPGASLEAARRRAEEVREAISQIEVRHGHGQLGPVTISAGVAIYPTQDEHQLLAAADAALYRAKRAGRNRVAIDTPEPEPGRVAIADSAWEPSPNSESTGLDGSLIPVSAGCCLLPEPVQSVAAAVLGNNEEGWVPDISEFGAGLTDDEKQTLIVFGFEPQADDIEPLPPITREQLARMLESLHRNGMSLEDIH